MVSKKTFFFIWVGLFHGCSLLAGPGILGLALDVFTPGQLSIEFVNVGGCLTSWGFGFGFLCSVSGRTSTQVNPFSGSVSLSSAPYSR